MPRKKGLRAAANIAESSCLQHSVKQFKTVSTMHWC